MSNVLGGNTVRYEYLFIHGVIYGGGVLCWGIFYFTPTRHEQTGNQIFNRLDTDIYLHKSRRKQQFTFHFQRVLIKIHLVRDDRTDIGDNQPISIPSAPF